MSKFFLSFVRFVLFGVFVVNLSYAQTQITRSFSAQTAMIGQPLYWTIDVAHPLWNSYQLSLAPCNGAEVTIASRTLFQKNDHVVTSFRIRIVPQALSMPDVPVVTLSDQSGHKTTITGKAVTVRAISGTSLDIQQPMTPPFHSATLLWLWILIGITIAGAISFEFWRRYKLSHNPRALFIRDLSRAQQEFRRERSPNATGLIRVLRSMFVWQTNVESRTPLELLEFASTDQRLLAVAQGLMVLEQYRYGTAPDAQNETRATRDEDKRIAERALAAAAELAGRGY